MTQLRKYARALRARQTEAENRLWYHLRGRRFMGLKFRRQVPLGRYIADFFCHELRLVIELDGGQHVEQANADQRRDCWLQERGYTVLRFWNHEVMQQLEAVLERLRLVVEEALTLCKRNIGHTLDRQHG